MGIEIRQNADGSADMVDDKSSIAIASFMSGGAFKSNSNLVPASISFVAAAGSANQSLVTITIKDGSGTAIASVINFDLWLSDSATGAGLTATTASGTVAVNTSSGVDLVVYTAKKAQRSQTLATGIYTLAINDTAKTGFYVCAQLPGSGIVQVSTQLITANYG